MALISCPKCGRQISDKAKSCPQCGYLLNHTEATSTQTTAEVEKKLKSNKKRIWLLCILVTCIVGAGLFVYSLFYSPKFDESNIGKYKGYSQEQLMALANKNDVEAITQIGRNALQSGDSIGAYKWFMKAAEQGYPVAEHNIGVCYSEGMGVGVNFSEAFKWSMKAAKQGFAGAQHNVGVALLNGYGIEKNPQEAFKWFMKAAKQGEAYDMLNVAMCYYQGLGTKVDKDEAQKWLKKLAEQENLSQEDYTLLESQIKSYGEVEEPVVEEAVAVAVDTCATDSVYYPQITSNWKYETRNNAMTDQVGYTATQLSNESHDGARLELTIAYVNDGNPSMVSMCFNPVDVINFKTSDPNEIYTIKYRFDGGNVVTQECMMRNKYDMILEHSATAHGAQKYSGKWTKNLINSDKLAIELETTRGNKIYTFDTQGLEWNHSYQK